MSEDCGVFAATNCDGYAVTGIEEVMGGDDSVDFPSNAERKQSLHTASPVLGRFSTAGETLQYTHGGICGGTRGGERMGRNSVTRDDRGGEGVTMT